MQDKHIFSKAYTNRREAVLTALRREEALRAEKPARRTCGTFAKLLTAAALLSVLTVTVYAAVQWVEVRMERNGNAVHLHAEIAESPQAQTAQSDQPPRSWNAQDGEVSVRLNIPDLPADMSEWEHTNGKFHSEDSSRAMTVNGIDLRRSALDELIGGADDVQKLDAGGKPLYVISSDSEAAFYNRTAFLVFEKEALVLKLWVGYGITDDELLAMTATMTLEETDDAALALPIINEVSGSYDPTKMITVERDPIYVTDLLEIGQSAREHGDDYTVAVDRVEVFDNIHVLNPNCFLNRKFAGQFVDGAGNLIPYTRTEIVYTQDEDGYVSMQFGESVQSSKKLYVITLTLSDVTADYFEEEDRDYWIRAWIHGFNLTNYTVENGEIELQSTSGVVIDRRPETHADRIESIYREYLGGDQWRVAYLVDETIAEEPLVFSSYTAKIRVKIQ